MEKRVDGGSNWMEGTRKTEVRLDGRCEGGLGSKGKTVEDARHCAKVNKEWRVLVHMY